FMDGVSVYDARLHMGEYLGDNVARSLRLGDIDVVMPIPDSARPAAMQLASRLDLTYREGFIKNRYVGRTFIMPGQAVRKNRCVRSSAPSIWSFAARTCCWWTTRSYAARPAVRSWRWRGRPGRTRCISPLLRRLFATPMSTASTCPRRRS